MLIITNMIVWCLVLDERSDLWPLLYLAEGVFLLELHSQSLMTNLLPRTTNLHTPFSIYLSSDDLMSLDRAHGLIPIAGPFIPTIVHSFAPLEKKGDFDLLITILPTFMSSLSVQASFQLSRSTLLMLWHLGRFHIYFTQHLVPHVLRCDGNLMVEKFHGDLGGNPPAYFFPLIYIYCLKILAILLFAFSTLKN